MDSDGEYERIGSSLEGSMAPDVAIADILKKLHPRVDLSITVPVNESISNQQFFESYAQRGALKCFKYGAITGLTSAWFSRIVNRFENSRDYYNIVLDTHLGESAFAEGGDSGSLVFVTVDDRIYLLGMLAGKYTQATSLDANASYRVEAVFAWQDFAEELVKERIRSKGSLLINPTYGS